MSTPITVLARERAKAFRRSFSETSLELFTDDADNRLYHPGEYGGYRERLLRHLLMSFIPGYLDMSDGFIINGNNQRSTQVDVVIFDKAETPNIETSDLRRFFPLETTCGVGEVKSTLSVPLLKAALTKLSAIKFMRNAPPPILIPARPAWRTHECVIKQIALQEEFESNKSTCDKDEIEHLTHEHSINMLHQMYNPVDNQWQNIVTFLVCSKINMNNNDSFTTVVQNIVREPTSEAGFAMRHNMLLSLEDGYQSYATGDNIPVPYPRFYNAKLNMHAATGIKTVLADDECSHIIAFIADLSSALSETAVYTFTVASHFDIEFQFSPV